MAKYHPVIILLYFMSVTSITMFVMHPIYLLVSLSSSFALHLLVTETDLRKRLPIYGWVFCMIVIVNPLIIQEGEQILFSFGTRVITLEAVLYGLFIAVMLISVLCWFDCYNQIMTSDKFLYVFGKFLPTLALTIIITLRLVPRFQQRLQKIILAQRAIGLDYTVGSIQHRLTSIKNILSILMTWALENAVETADVMKARGYGLQGKTSFSFYIFHKRDGLFLAIYCILISVLLIGFVQGSAQFSFYPALSSFSFDKSNVFSMLSFFLLCSLPVLVEVKERRKWRY